MSAFYAFCSLSDDIADKSSSRADADRHADLMACRTSLDRCFRGQPDSAVFLALMDVFKRFNLPQQPFVELLDGVEMDLEPRRYETFDDLQLYCRRVASSVGRVSVRIFGAENSGADEYADLLGIAFQLTNILRDLGEDLHRHRVYLPQEDLKRFSYSDGELFRGVYNDRYLELMQFEYRRTREYYDLAAPRLAGSQFRKLLPAEIMKAVYRDMLEELQRYNFRVFSRRISLPAWRKTAAVVRAVARHLIRDPS